MVGAVFGQHYTVKDLVGCREAGHDCIVERFCRVLINLGSSWKAMKLRCNKQCVRLSVVNDSGCSCFQWLMLFQLMVYMTCGSEVVEESIHPFFPVYGDPAIYGRPLPGMGVSTRDCDPEAQGAYLGAAALLARFPITQLHLRHHLWHFSNHV